MPETPTPGQLAYAAFTRVFDPQHVQWRLWPDVPRRMQLAWEAAARGVLEAHASLCPICGAALDRVSAKEDDHV